MSNEMPLQVDQIGSLIQTIHGQKVMLDSDLAMLYGVSTKALNQAVKRNFSRFPPDFLFQLTQKEVVTLNRSQIVTGSLIHCIGIAVLSETIYCTIPATAENSPRL